MIQQTITRLKGGRRIANFTQSVLIQDSTTDNDCWSFITTTFEQSSIFKISFITMFIIEFRRLRHVSFPFFLSFFLSLSHEQILVFLYVLSVITEKSYH